MRRRWPLSRSTWCSLGRRASAHGCGVHRPAPQGRFEQLTPADKGAILREHGLIGRAYGAQDLAHDVRLACHGLDSHDNEFVIGLIGKQLYPLSHVVQHMRSTRQTAEFIAQMGPFFVGHVCGRVLPTSAVP
ncbi:MAG: chlorite dismutase family protein [Polyangiales bacterium]